MHTIHENGGAVSYETLMIPYVHRLPLMKTPDAVFMPKCLRHFHASGLLRNASLLVSYKKEDQNGPQRRRTTTNPLLVELPPSLVTVRLTR